MYIKDVKRNIEDLWSDTSVSWKDPMSEKYKAAIIDQMESLLDFIQNSYSQLVTASEEALRQLKEIQE